jgi:four helix bundle protein
MLQDRRFTFPHERLDAFHVAVQLAELAHRMASRVPRGYARRADQLRRSGTAPVALIAEGANRRGRGNKRQRFDEACGEAGEAVGHARLLAALRLYRDAEQDYEALRACAQRVVSMTSRLVRKFS